MVDGATVTVTSIRALGQPAEEVFPAQDVALPDICVSSNASAELQAGWRPAYAARIARPQDVSLIRLPQGTEVSGRAGFAARSGTHLLAEQLTRDDPVDPAGIMDMFTSGDPLIEVDVETVLIARFGEGTWGHWLVELLPKLAVCEATWPGRFHYAVPGRILQGGLFSQRIFESMAAYGVAAERLVRVQANQVMRFSRLFALTPVFSDHIPHPDVLALMNFDKPARLDCEVFPNVALMRQDSRRRIQNLAAVEAVLRDHRFAIVDVAVKSFQEQRQLLSASRAVFSVLGSTLAGLIFSPEGTHVTIAAPELFGDRFFYGILQLKHGASWAEARGPIVATDACHYRDSSFEVPLDALAEGLEWIGI